MSASEIQLKLDARAAFTITLANLASLGSRQSTMIANTNKRHGALVTVVLRAGTNAPTGGAKYKVHLLRSDGTNADDNAGGSDANLAIENAPLLGEIEVTADAAKTFTKTFDTWPLGPLGPTWGIAIVNATDQAMHATGSSAAYQTYVPEAQ